MVLVFVIVKVKGAREYVLMWLFMIVGWMDDNDIVIEYCLILWYYVKILWCSGGVFMIVDMDLVNGVKVNGECYKCIDFYFGDEFEFGYVKVKFVFSVDMVFEFGVDYVDLLVVDYVPLFNIGKMVVIVFIMIGVVVVVFWFFYFFKIFMMNWDQCAMDSIE